VRARERWRLGHGARMVPYSQPHRAAKCLGRDAGDRLDFGHQGAGFGLDRDKQRVGGGVDLRAIAVAHVGGAIGEEDDPPAGG